MKRHRTLITQYSSHIFYIFENNNSLLLSRYYVFFAVRRENLAMPEKSGFGTSKFQFQRARLKKKNEGFCTKGIFQQYERMTFVYIFSRFLI